MLDGRQILNKALTRKVLESLHASTHCGAQALCDNFLQTYGCVGTFEVTRAVIRNCMICQRINRKFMRRTTPGGRELARRPFQNIQTDFTELPLVWRFKY